MGSVYEHYWDKYVAGWAGEGRPGDEWGRPQVWDTVYKRFFAGADGWQKAVEIGPGSGKYTAKVLQNPAVSVRGYDVSEKFLEVCSERCADHVASGRLDLRPIDTARPDFLLDDLRDWKRQVDAVYSIGVMVHIDLQYLIAYLVTAAAVLQPGGKLIATFGNPTTDVGFERLLEDIRPQWRGQFEPSGKYEWLGGCVVASLLPRLGFDIDVLNEPNGINVAVVASLARPEIGDDLSRYL